MIKRLDKYGFYVKQSYFMRIFVLNLIFLVCGLLFSGASSFASEAICKVVKVSDGDTVTCLDAENRQTKIRLYGIDAPEKKQDFGQKSRQTLASMVAGKIVEVEEAGRDRYGRTIGLIKSDGQNVNEEMIKRGYAWVYSQYCKKAFCEDWKQAEENARNNRLGIWQERAIPPWEWRKKR